MDQHAAAQVLWVRAVETAAPASWSDQDAAWASQRALQAVGSEAPAEAFLAQRARAALQRLVQREPAWAFGPAPGHGWWLPLAMAAGLLAGLLAERIGASQRIDLLAPPVWAVIVWNLLVYLALLWPARASAAAPPRLVQRAAQALARRGLMPARKPPGPNQAATAVWAAFVPDWSRLAAPLLAARWGVCLHAAAALLGVGLLAGMYLRGLVLDYRVGWQSTFLSADSVQPLLATLLAPASWLTGIAVPDVAGIQALQLKPEAAADVPAAVGSAADWIHLYAAQLLLLVVLPRLGLTLWSARRARRLADEAVLPLHEPYFQRLLAQQRGRVQQVCVWPYALSPDAQAQATLQALLQRGFGGDTRWRLAPGVAFGAEDDWQPAPAEGERALALFDLSATPEAENHGRFVQRLVEAAGAPVPLLVDQAGFVRRFSAERVRQRRQAWQALADALGAQIVFVDLQSDPLAAAAADLQGLA